MFYKNTATVYTRSRNANNVSSYSAGDSFTCKIQPVWLRDWFDWAIMYKTRKLYTEYDWLKIWDKIVCNWDSYVVRETLEHDGIMWHFNICFIEKSEWA